MVGVLRIHPHVVEIAVRAAADAAERRSAVGAHDERTVRLVDAVLVLRVHDEVREIERPPGHVLAAVPQLPCLAAVVRPIEPVQWRHRLDEGVHDVWLRWSHRHRNATPRFDWKSLGTLVVERDPRRTAVGAPEQATPAWRVRSLATGAKRPARATEIPHAGVQRVRRRRIHCHYRAPGGRVRSGQHLRPRLAAVGRLVHAAVVAVAPELAGNAGIHRVRVHGIDQNLRNALGVPKAHVDPGLAAVGGLVDAVAEGDAVAHPGLAGAGPHGPGVLRVDGDRSDGLHILLVEDRLEGGSAAHRLPHATARAAYVDGEAIAFVDRRDGGHAATHCRGTDVPGAEARRRFGVDECGQLVEWAERGGDGRRRNGRGTRACHRARRSGRLGRGYELRAGRRLCEALVVDSRVHGDAFPRVLLLFGARAALGANRGRKGKQDTLDFLVVAELDLERALGAAHRALHLVLDWHAGFGIQVVRAHVAIARERGPQLVDGGAFDLVGANEFHLVAALLVVEQRVVELRVLDDSLGFVFTERLGVLLARPRFDLPAALAVEGRHSGHPAERELLSHLVRAPILVGDHRLESASAIEPAALPHGLDGAQALRAADSPDIARDDLVGRWRRLGRSARRNREHEGDDGQEALSHRWTPQERRTWSNIPESSHWVAPRRNRPPVPVDAAARLASYYTTNIAIPAANIAKVVMPTIARDSQELGWPRISLRSDAACRMPTIRNGASRPLITAVQ